MHSKEEKVTKRIDETGAKLVDNPEYVYSLVDSVEHVLFSIDYEGCVDWQKGIFLSQ